MVRRWISRRFLAWGFHALFLILVLGQLYESQVTQAEPYKLTTSVFRHFLGLEHKKLSSDLDQQGQADRRQTYASKSQNEEISVNNTVNVNVPVPVPVEQRYFGKISEIYPDEGELAEVKFLTKRKGHGRIGLGHKRPRRRRSYYQGYHIVQLRIASLRQTLHLHLTASLIDHTKTNSKSGDGDGEHDGHYSGTISEDSTGGGVALSLDEHGFTGFLIFRESHFILEPVITNSSQGENSIGHHPGNGTLLHRIYRSADILKNDVNKTFDVLQVPADELEKARQEMANSTWFSEPDEGKTGLGDTDADDSTLGTEILDHDDSEDTLLERGININTFASRGNKNKGKKGGKGKHTSRAQSADSKIVELAVFTDAKLFSSWKEKFPKTAKTQLKAFVLNIIHNMNLLYGQPSLGSKIAFRLIHLEILTSEPSNLKPVAEGAKYLKTFCKYAGDKNSHGSNWDHALLLTGQDITDDKGVATVIGMAWSATMCLQYWSCSINEGMNFGASVVLTHEIGHSFAISHDGEETAKSCDASKHIMSPTTGRGKITWSSCSARDIKNFLATGTAKEGKKDEAGIPRCLAKVSKMKSQTEGKLVKSSDKLPGEIYSLQEQCKMFCGKCIPAPSNMIKLQDICPMIFCGDNQRATSAHPALEGTPCGNGNHCRLGKCVKKSKV